MPNNIIDKIRVSGTDYTLSATTSGVSVVEVTQAEYDALPSSAKTDTSKMYVITDAEAGDLTNYYTKTETNALLGGKADTATTYTKTETDNAITAATATKQDTLVSSVNIKTINNESLLGSGNIDIQGGGSGVSVVEVTQAEYDELPSSAKTDTSKMYVITDAQAGDLSQYWTSAQTNSAITEATSGKVDSSSVVTAVTSASTDNEIPTAKAVFDAIPTGGTGGGKAVSAGTNISVTTGETADTINCTLPFSYEGDNLKTTVSENSFVNYFHYGQIFGIDNKLQGKNSSSGAMEKNTTIIGYSNQLLKMDNSIVIGSSNNLGNIFGINNHNYVFGFSNTVNPVNTQDNLVSNNFVIGNNNTINQKSNNFIFGYGIKPSNNDEFSLGKYNNSVSGSSTFGDSGNTLFSVGNGTADNARHNAFEIRQNGDIYISSGGTDIKLQDYLGGGGGGGTVESAITSGSTNAVESKAIWSAVTYDVSINETLEFDNTYAATNYPSGCNSVTFENNTGGTLPTGDYVFTSGGSEIAKLTCSVISWWPYEVGWTSSDPKLTYVVAEGNSAVTASYSELAGDIDGVTVPSAFTSASTATASGENHLWINENTYRKDEVDGIASSLQTNINEKLDATAYTPTVVDSTLNDNSNNPVANSALYDELRISNTTGATETVITFDSDNFSENYPVKCRKIKVEVTGTTFWSYIKLLSDKSESGSTDNQISWINDGQAPLSVQLGGGLTEAGATYTISGNTFEVSYPSINNIQYIYKGMLYSETIKAITSGTPLKDQVVANTTALGGLSLVKLTQAQYDALSPNYDSNTLYVIVN